MKKNIILVLTALLLLISQAGSAADIYACTRDTSQGAVFEYYVREESCHINISKEQEQELCADIITVRKDRWGHKTPPLIVEWRFLNFDTVPVFVKFDKQTGKATERNRVENDPIATKIFEIVKGVLLK